MNSLSFPGLAVALFSLLAGAAVCWRGTPAGGHRYRAAGFCSLALAGLATAAWEVHAAGHQSLADAWLPWLEASPLNLAPMMFYLLLTAFYLLLAPRRDADSRSVSGMLMLAGATLLAYAAGNLAVMAAGWWLTAVPFAAGFFGRFPARRAVSGFMMAGSLALTLALFFLHATAVADLSHASMLAFALLLLAVMLRKGVFPFHSWVVNAFENGPLLPAALLFNGHLGALLVARSEMVPLPDMALRLLDVLSVAAMVTALLTTLRAFAEKKPRRLLALICVSQASFILAGMATANPEGITGGLLHWLVVAAASSGLVAIVRILEVRVLDVTDPAGSLGLAVKAPRLATFFLISGLALIGLPGTLGYCAEDLIFHGALESHPFLGIALPVATAFNAIHLFRLFSLLFLGVLPKHVIDIPDALPRERWPLAVCLVFLIAGGLLPGAVIAWRSPAARIMAESISGTPASAH